jgi:methylphosphotriester-DNA--protein-cysteine methyltransferase
MSVLPARRLVAGLIVLVAFVVLATSASAALDAKAPTKPGNLRVTAKTLTSVSMAWNASTDNSGNFSYRVRLWGDSTVVTLRFARATGHSPIAYVQHVRVEEAKRRLERTSDPVDRISYAVGYEDPASFRRLFKRITGVPPGVYRRKLQLPAFARTPPRKPARPPAP